MSEKKSPLKTKPLHSPGHSLQQELEDLILDKVLPWIMIPVVLAIMAIIDWVMYLLRTPRMPWLYTFMAVISIPLAIWRIRWFHSMAHPIRQGLQGERVVGQELEKLRAIGYEVIHDIPGNGHNIDHVLVGPGGIFAIETKTISKPKGDKRVVFDGEKVTVAGHVPDRNPIAQIRAAAKELGTIIYDRVGERHVIRSVVLYPGWYTESRGKSEVWVLNEKALPKWLANENEKLTAAEIQKIKAGIERHVLDTVD